MGAVGTGADNALAESFNASLKRETLQGAHAWPDHAACRRAVFGWVNRYNTRRRHSYCGQSALGLVSRALTHLAAGERSAAQGDLRHAQQLWPAHAGVDLAVLRAVAEQFGAGPTGPTASAIADTDQLPSQPELEALARLSQALHREVVEPVSVA